MLRFLSSIDEGHPVSRVLDKACGWGLVKTLETAEKFLLLMEEGVELVDRFGGEAMSFTVVRKGVRLVQHAQAVKRDLFGWMDAIPVQKQNSK